MEDTGVYAKMGEDNQIYGWEAFFSQEYTVYNMLNLIHYKISNPRLIRNSVILIINIIYRSTNAHTHIHIHTHIHTQTHTHTPSYIAVCTKAHVRKP